jgi:hypothetical protein
MDVDRLEEVRQDHTNRTETLDVISYATALSLWHVEGWLKEVASLSGDARS